MRIQLDKKNLYKYLAAVGVLLAIVIAIIVIRVANREAPPVNLSITVAPQSATILINDQVYENGEYHVENGDYHVEISKDGFVSKTLDLKIDDDNPGYVFIALEQTDGSTSWYEEHPEDAALLDPIFNQNVVENAKRIEEEYPLTTRLPIKIDMYNEDYSERTYYEVSYEVDRNGEVTVVIKDYTGGNKEHAYEKIRARGFDPEDYNIRYEDLSEDLVWGHAH